MITKTELTKYRIVLEDKCEALKQQSDATSEDRATVTLDQQSVGRLSRMDAMQQQAMAKATQQRRAHEITRAQAAISRIDEGEFGFCTECGEPIGKPRLDHDPSLPWCMDCAKAR